MFTTTSANTSDSTTLLVMDSGPVLNSSTYTTLVIYHGTAFNGHGFVKLHEFANKFDLRIIIINRKDYDGSSKYTDPELDDLHNGREVALKQISAQICVLLNLFIARDIPKISPDRQSGGIIIMGWSMGCATALTLFAYPDLIDPVLYAKMKLYVKNLVLYDPPYCALGYDLPEVPRYTPLSDPRATEPKDVVQNFKIWVSSYYDAHDRSTGNMNDLDMRRSTPHTTVDKWTSEELDSFFEETPAIRVELPMFLPPMQKTLNGVSARVLFDAESRETSFPDVPVTYITCKRSVWFCAWAEMVTRKRYEAAIEKGEKVRPIKFFSLDDNHFAHWDNPERLLKTVIEGARSLGHAPILSA